MTTINIFGATLTVIYVDPTNGSPVAGATPAGAITSLPSPSLWAANTIYLIRRTATAITLGASAQTWANSQSYLMGMPTVTDAFYTHMPAEAISAWGADAAVLPKLTFPAGNWYVTMSGNYKGFANIRFQYPASGTQISDPYSTFYSTTGDYHIFTRIEVRVVGIDTVDASSANGIDYATKFLYSGGRQAIYTDIDVQLPPDSTLATGGANGFGPTPGGNFLYFVGTGYVLRRIKIRNFTLQANAATTYYSYQCAIAAQGSPSVIEDIDIKFWDNLTATNYRSVPYLFYVVAAAAVIIRRVRCYLAGSVGATAAGLTAIENNSAYINLVQINVNNTARVSDIWVKYSYDEGSFIGSLPLLSTRTSSRALVLINAWTPDKDAPIVENVEVYICTAQNNGYIFQSTNSGDTSSNMSIRGLILDISDDAMVANGAPIVAFDNCDVSGLYLKNARMYIASTVNLIVVESWRMAMACSKILEIVANDANARIWIKDASQIDPFNESATLATHIVTDDNSRITADRWGMRTGSSNIEMGTTGRSKQVSLYNMGGVPGNIMIKTEAYTVLSSIVRRSGSASNMSFRLTSTGTLGTDSTAYLPDVHQAPLAVAIASGTQIVRFFVAFKNLANFATLNRQMQILLELGDGTVHGPSAVELQAGESWINDTGLTCYSFSSIVTANAATVMYVRFLFAVDNASAEFYVDPLPTFQAVP